MPNIQLNLSPAVLAVFTLLLVYAVVEGLQWANIHTVGHADAALSQVSLVIGPLLLAAVGAVAAQAHTQAAKNTVQLNGVKKTVEEVVNGDHGPKTGPAEPTT